MSVVSAVDVGKDEVGTMLCCAVRYAALQGGPCVPAAVVESVEKFLPYLNDKSVKALDRELTELEKDENFGGPVDHRWTRPQFRALKRRVLKEEKKRGLKEYYTSEYWGEFYKENLWDSPLGGYL